MTIKGLLIGSAAALAAVSGAQAADAIVAAEPEAVEYVRVCDSFGAGFFYIPGSETCLKVGGYVRFQTNFGRDAKGTSDWNSFTRAQLSFDARTETEIGAVRSLITLRGQPDTAGDKTGVWVEEAFLDVAGLRAGKFYSIWDNSLSGETDVLSSNALFNSVRYTYDAGAAAFGLSVDELQGVDLNGATVAGGTTNDNNVGIAAHAVAALAGVNFELVGGYDVDREEGAVRAIATAAIGPGTLGVSAAYATGENAYFSVAEWTVAAEYAVNVTEKLKLTPGAQYFADYELVSGVDAWKAGLTADYAITSGLAAKAHVEYTDVDGLDEEVSGFVRLQRSF
jgi:hypothetical protein